MSNYLNGIDKRKIERGLLQFKLHTTIERKIVCFCNINLCNSVKKFLFITLTISFFGKISHILSSGTTCSPIFPHFFNFFKNHCKYHPKQFKTSRCCHETSLMRVLLKPDVTYMSTDHIFDILVVRSM